MKMTTRSRPYALARSLTKSNNAVLGNDNASSKRGILFDQRVLCASARQARRTHMSIW